MTDSTQMTLEQVIATLEARDLFAEASFIKALLAPREVSDEDVFRARRAYAGRENIDTSDQLVNGWMRAALESFAQSLPAPSVPTGFVLVPVEPTDRMIDAAERLWTSEEIYKAMIAAAPQAGERG